MRWMCDGTQALGWVLSMWGGKLERKKNDINACLCAYFVYACLQIAMFSMHSCMFNMNTHGLPLSSNIMWLGDELSCSKMVNIPAVSYSKMVNIPAVSCSSMVNIPAVSCSSMVNIPAVSCS